MIVVDWTALALGIAAGIAMSTLFFAGLAFGVQRALRDEKTVAILALSAALRIAAFLGVGWLVVTQAGPWAFAGYGIAFLGMRRLSMTIARRAATTGGAQ